MTTVRDDKDLAKSRKVNGIVLGWTQNFLRELHVPQNTGSISVWNSPCLCSVHLLDYDSLSISVIRIRTALLILGSPRSLGNNVYIPTRQAQMFF